MIVTLLLADSFGRLGDCNKTCYVHAEWRAVINACKRNADKIGGSVLYFMRIDDDGNVTDAGEPNCTACSRFTMESGIGEFALWNDGGADVYPIAAYDELSYRYYELPRPER